MTRRFYNWARTEHCTPASFQRPSSEEELVAIIREARRANKQIKVIGARHSWSDIAMPCVADCVLVSLDNMQALLEVDPARGRVRAQAGIRLHRLNDELATRGLALSIVGSVVEQSLAGVVSTGTHGSSLVHGNIPSFVVGLRVITGTGEVLDIAEHDPLLPAARVGLGGLGIITQVSVRVEPRFQLRETTQTVSFAAALANMQALARSAEYVKLWWLPHTDTVMVFRCERTEAAGEPSKLLAWIDRIIINKLVFPLVLGLGRVIPRLIPPSNRLVARTYLDRAPRVGRADRILSLAMPPRHRETEYAVPLEHAAEALRQTRALIERSGVRVNFITELRFVKGDDAWMSPASGRDSCQLGAYMAAAPGLAGYFEAFEAAMRALDGRPHWGKEFRATPEDIVRMYPKAEAFAAKLRELDPDGVFHGRLLTRVFPRTPD
ncbi:D-arabinono-1,4-lactone oxidase [Enhygromyxa salina]|uniref:L-gulono-1,4-lactone dehydrogenase n=1 Tax=Enhygromyxa salina TaxID=215803 RepID=A0A2S9YUF4_9BACT|nr:D-arabinono-1,4-lactone oxidase [Enhygromyxa salina]PRQ08737.1 L-gulono-1,4-lactone dehydrogenase [Enhygromyxa salina]